MGNCLTCFQVSVPPAEHNSNNIQTKEEMCDVQYTPSLQSSNNVHSEAALNGNQKVGVTLVGGDISGSLSRFCTRTRSSQNHLSSGDSKVSDHKIIVLFEHYKDATEDCILPEGIEQFCNDLQMSPDEFRILLLAWKLNAEQMCRFTRTEFLQGLRVLKADSIRALQTRLSELVSEVERDSEQFKDLYRFTFRFGLDVAAGQRILPVEMAICLWRLVFTVREPPVLHRWLDFLQAHPQVRGIPRDTWNMFLNFSETVGADLSAYDDTEAWPSLFDDFVEYENDQANQNVPKECDKEMCIKND